MKDNIILACGSDHDMTSAQDCKDLLSAKGYDVAIIVPELWDDELRSSIKNCKAFVLIVSQGIFDRCWNPGDAFKKAIEYALFSGKFIYLLRNGDFEFPSTLPPTIDALRHRQMRSIYLETRDPVAENLVKDQTLSDELWDAIEEDAHNSILPERPIDEMAGIAVHDIENNWEECMKLILRAQAHNHEAQLCIAKYYLDDRPTERLLRKNDTRAVYWLRQAVKHRNAEAMYLLARCYEKGKGISKDLRYAAFFYEESARCEKPWPAAVFRVADCYLEGIGVTRERLKQAHWLREAAKLEAQPAAVIYAEKYMDLLDGPDKKISALLREAGYLTEDLSPEQRETIAELRRKREKEAAKGARLRNAELELEERERAVQKKRHLNAIVMAIFGTLFSVIGVLGAGWMGWIGFDPRPMPYWLLLSAAAVLCGVLLAPLSAERGFFGNERESVVECALSAAMLLAMSGTLVYFLTHWIHLAVLWIAANWIWIVVDAAGLLLLIIIIAILMNKLS